MEQQRLSHDLSKCHDIEFFLKAYDYAFLEKELLRLATKKEYPYKPAIKMYGKLIQYNAK